MFKFIVSVIFIIVTAIGTQSQDGAITSGHIIRFIITEAIADLAYVITVPEVRAESVSPHDEP